MVRQQPEFIYRETARHLITRPFRWFHYPLALSFHKDINSPTRWLVRVNALPRGTPRRFIEIGGEGEGGEGGDGQGKKGRKIFEKIRCCSSVNSCEFKRPSLLSFWRGGEGFRKSRDWIWRGPSQTRSQIRSNRASREISRTVNRWYRAYYEKATYYIIISPL